MADVEKDILVSVATKPGRGYLLTCGLLGLILVWGIIAWTRQVQEGLGVTGLNAPVFWGVYLVNFVFFIGISHAGTLISSVLRITDTPWRRPFTRLAEAITVFSLPFGALSVIVDLGGPHRLLYVLKFPHFTSAVLWDVVCITTYLITSCFYFYLALVPDIAVCANRLTEVSPWRRQIYRTLSLNWTGTERQHKVLNRIMTGMSIFLFALVISVHTNVSFVFGMTTKPGWHTTLISPFFVLGAIYSGVAAVICFAALLRKLFHLEAYITKQHFNSVAKFLLALCCFWLYAMIIEHLFVFYGKGEAELRLFESKVLGQHVFMFWLMFALCFPVPFVVLAVPKFRTIRNLVIVCLLVNIGMWMERYSIIIPSGVHPYLPWGDGQYFPSWVEWSITASWVSGFTLLLLLFVRFFPPLTIWEIKEELEGAKAEPEPGEAPGWVRWDLIKALESGKW
ncbi:MAG: polysulfide reductase NrfD [Acidobacteria bacterium]|nr:polysulfide reductase NrfD [Acidobacteriota bacterium]